MTAAAECLPAAGAVATLQALGLSSSTYYRRKKPLTAFPSKRKAPPRTLTPEEKQAALDVLHEDRFVDRPPAEIVATLADEGRYVASERTMYRVLEANREVRERRNQLVLPAYSRPELVATGPNQVWSWDITKLPTFTKFVYLSLYVVIDIFSRYVVGWMLAQQESAALATRLIDETISKHAVKPEVLTLHADRGAPMRSKLLAQLLADLDVTRSFNRPHTSNDNPYSESHFKTMKYHPGFPRKHYGMADGQVSCRRFFPWYNDQHHHSGIQMLTPADVHFERAAAVLKRRHDLMMDRYHEHPERFVNGPPRLRQLPSAVFINPPEPPAASASDNNPLPAASSAPALTSVEVDLGRPFNTGRSIH